MSEKEQLELNAIQEGSVAEWIYREYRKKGLSIEDSIKHTVDAINNIRSQSMDEEILKVLKNAFFKVPGNWV